MLTSSFYQRPTCIVAEALLGKFLVREWNGTQIASMITEVEAYDGPEDRASHASRGVTPRTRVMFGTAGVWYVYLVYGMHHMLNVVTGEEGYPAAVLIRATEAVSGPARLTKFFHIDRGLNAASAARESGLWIEDRGVTIAPDHVHRKPRIGVEYAGEEWASKPLRWVLG